MIGSYTMRNLTIVTVSLVAFMFIGFIFSVEFTDRTVIEWDSLSTITLDVPSYHTIKLPTKKL